MRSLCVKVLTRETEKVRRFLASKNLLAPLKIKRCGDYVLIPVRERVHGFEICEDDFEPLQVTSQKVGSFDIVGDVAIIKSAADRDLNKIIRELEKRKNVKKIALDHGIQGEERVRYLELVKGCSLETMHREYGIRLKVDLSKVYFSPRLATERWRVVQRVKDGEAIFDMFAGCGPFSILIAKYRKVTIYACDINPHAVAYLKENIKLNKVEGVHPLLGDVRDMARLVPPVDRIIMNLPHSSFKFLDMALNKIKKDGEIHYYEILPEKHNRREDLQNFARKIGKDVEILETRKVHGYAPGVSLYSFLLRVK